MALPLTMIAATRVQSESLTALVSATRLVEIRRGVDIVEVANTGTAPHRHVLLMGTRPNVLAIPLGLELPLPAGARRSEVIHDPGHPVQGRPSRSQHSSMLPWSGCGWSASSGRCSPLPMSVVGLDGALRIADRHSEHVSCAGEREVLAAGEMFFADGRVARVSNQSSGFEFRRCDACGQRNIVKDDDFTCAICGGELPATWNFTS